MLPVIAAILAFAPPAAAPNAGLGFFAVPGEREFSGNLVVRMLQNLRPMDRARAEAMVAPTTLTYVEATDEFIVTAARGPQPAGEPERALAAQLMATGLFQYAEPDWTVYPVATPNDARFGDQWHHAMMQSASAWDLGTGSTSMIVAVTDTGIITHQDLGNRVSGYNAASGVAEANGGVMTDINGHGTHVAGCAAASGNNSVGVVGMGWNLRVMPVRVSEASTGSASMSVITAGARWAADNGAKTVSASYSGIGSTTIETTGEYLHSIDASLLWAANNNAENHAGFDFANVLVVGASDSTDARSSFSSYGRAVDLFAPGSSILATTFDGGYGTKSGTSMATPVANGALAMVRSANPLLSARHAEHILLHTCDPWDGYEGTEEYGYGRINLRRAMQTALTALTPQPPVANADRARGVSGTSIVIDVLENDFDPNMDALGVDVVPAVTSLGDQVELLPGDGPEGRDAVRVTIAASAAPGNRTFTYRLLEPVSGATSVATVTVEVQTPARPTAPIGDTAGLECRYYVLTSPTTLPDYSTMTPFLTETVATVDWASTTGNFANSGRADNVGASIQGWLNVPTSGRWTLNLYSDDGSRLWVDGALAVDNNGVHGMTRKWAVLPLAAGKHAIRLDYFEAGSSAGLQFSWSGPGIGTQVVPASALTTGGAPLLGDLDGDGRVGGSDLGLMLAAWGPGTNLPADLNRDGVVNGADMGSLLGAWTR